MMRRAVLVLALASACSRPVVHTPAPTPKPVPKSDVHLDDLMRSRIHDRFTVMSYVVFHRDPLTGEDRAQVGEAAAQLADLAARAPWDEYVEGNWSKADLAFYRNSARELVDTSQRVSRFAPHADKGELERRFLEVQATCDSCHMRFRSDLVGE